MAVITQYSSPEITFIFCRVAALHSINVLNVKAQLKPAVAFMLMHFFLHTANACGVNRPYSADMLVLPDVTW